MDELADLDAPNDVMATIEWLVDEGFEIARLLTRNQANGNKLVDLVSDEWTVMITRDRGQWMLDLLFGDWSTDLGVALDAKTGQTVSTPPPGGERFPSQLPVGVEWSSSLPELLAWLDAADRREVVDEAKRRRSELLWPKR